MNDYREMKKQLLRHGINIDNKFEFNNKLYCFNDILDYMHILPINFKNYNYIFYLQDYYSDKLTTFNEFIDAFNSVYGNDMYLYFKYYLNYIENIHKIRFS